MGTNTLTTALDGTVINTEDVNQFKTALQLDLVPRNASGVATNNAGNLGTSSLRWQDLFVDQIYIQDPTDNNIIADAAGDLTIRSDNNVRILNNTNTVALFDANGMDATYLEDLTITTAKIGANQVTSAKIANDAIVTAQIQNLQVTTAKIDNEAVTSGKIGDNEVSDNNMNGLTYGVSSTINDSQIFASGVWGTMSNVVGAVCSYTTGGSTSFRQAMIVLQSAPEIGTPPVTGNGTVGFFGLESSGGALAVSHLQGDLVVQKRSTTFSGGTWSTLFRSGFNNKHLINGNVMTRNIYYPLNMVWIDDDTTSIGTGELVEYRLMFLPIAGDGAAGLRMRIDNGIFRVHLIR